MTIPMPEPDNAVSRLGTSLARAERRISNLEAQEHPAAVEYYLFQARLTLESGVPVSTTSQTAKTAVYLCPFRGNKIGLYDGTGWTVRALSEIHIDLSQVLSGTTTIGSAVITNLFDTSSLSVGMIVTGTGIPAGTSVSTIDSSTQVTLSALATASGSNITLTFTAGANDNFDIFIYDDSGTIRLEMVMWASDTVRATALTSQDGIYVKSGDPTRRYCGTIRTTAVNGQTAIIFGSGTGVPFLGVWNYYNRVDVRLIVFDLTSNWSYAVAAWRAANASNNNRINAVIGVVEDYLTCTAVCSTSGTAAGGSCFVGVAIDATNTNHAADAVDAGITGFGGEVVSQFAPLIAEICYYPTVGFHFYQWTEYGNASGVTFYGKAGDIRRAGMIMKLKA